MTSCKCWIFLWYLWLKIKYRYRKIITGGYWVIKNPEAKVIKKYWAIKSHLVSIFSLSVTRVQTQTTSVRGSLDQGEEWPNKIISR